MTTYSASELLGRGFLPAELPPIFTSASLGTAYQQFKGELEPCKAPKGIAVVPTTFNLARQGTLRRRLSIPHPLYYAQLCQEIEAHSMLLHHALDRSTWSRSRPTVSGTGRALDRPLKERLIVEARAEVRATSRYLVQADISQFYHSIYTHTIGWSIAGKDKAKELKKHPDQKHEPAHLEAHIGNELDKKIRALQDGQSIGLPMGPDASFLLAEVLLCGVDQTLSDEFDAQNIRVVAMRNVDDYQIGSQSYDDAEKVLALLQRHLRTELELTLNPRKTKILTLPAPLEDPWVTELKGIVQATTGVPERQKRRELLRLFDLATAARSKYPEEHVYSYLLGILKHVNVGPNNWKLLQHMLLQIALAESGTLRQMLTDLLWYKKEGNNIDTDRWKDVFERMIKTHAPQEHSSEVVWALWGLYELGGKLSSAVVSAILKMEDAIVALLAICLAHHGLCESQDDMDRLKETYQRRVGRAGFFGEQWPLIYEATTRGWLEETPDLHDDRGYQCLKKHHVTFLDFSKRIDPSDHNQYKDYGSP